MAVITRTITNNLSTNLDLFVPGYNTIKPQVVITPSATVDLFTVLTGDELEAVQNQLSLLVTAGSITVNATVNTNTFNPVGGASGITALTGDVTASGTGSVAATVHNATNLTSQVITGNGSSVPLQIKPNVDSTTAIEMTTTSGVVLFKLDTVDGFLAINSGGSSPSRNLHVFGNAAVTTDLVAGTIHINNTYFTLEALTTAAAITATTPAAGTMAVASDTGAFYFYNGSAWKIVTVS